MKKIIASCAVILGFFLQGYSQDNSPKQPAGESNYSTFTKDKVDITPELESLTGKEFKNHPEYGVLPYNAPCKDCIELLQKRDESHRYFAKKGTNGKEFYAQTSYGAMNFADKNGAWRAIDSRMKPTSEAGIFKAGDQPSPVTINIPEKFTSVLSGGKELQVNNNLSIFVKHSDGSVTSLGEPNWQNYTAGDDGIMVHDFYPGIDLELKVGSGTIESFYHVNKPLNLTDGWLVIRDNMQVPQDLIYDYSYSDKKDDYYRGTVFLNDRTGKKFFFIATPAAIDINGQKDNNLSLNYQISGTNVYDIYVPVAWISDPSRSYPLIIDPFVSATTQTAASTITNSGYSPSCTAWTNPCTYLLNALVPPACVITNITTTFWFLALGSCWINQGAWDITYGTCRYPSAGTWNTCSASLPGRCQLTDLSCISNFQSCLPAPSCNPPPLPITLEFYRCVQPGGNCTTFSCIQSDFQTPKPWSITVTGRTVEITAHNDSLCEGSSINLSANATWGVPPYTFTWNPGNLVGNPVTVSPTAPTTYTVTVTTCGGIDHADTEDIVNVFPKDIPPFTINSTPACTGQPVIITAQGNPSASGCDWILPGTSVDSIKGQNPITVSYSNAGNYNITLNWTSPLSGCFYTSTSPITINAGQPPSVTISTPTNPICAGTNVTFTAQAIGNSLTYQWYDDSNPIPANNLPTYSSSTLQNGDTIKVVITDASVSCGSNTATSNVVVMVVNPIDTPKVTISVNPLGTLCPGTNVIFTAVDSNAGTAPGFQWQVNNAGNFSNGITWTTNSSNFNNGDLVTVILTSNDPCPSPPTVTSVPIIINVFPPVTVTTFGDTTVCAGQPVTICAIAANGTGGTYFYSWDNGAGNSSCVNVAPGATTVYTVSATDSCNSNPATGSVNVTILPPPIPNFTYTPSDISILTPTVNFFNLSQGATGWQWFFGDTSTCGVDSSTLLNPSYTYCAPGAYTVTLIDTNASGCSARISQTLDVNDEYYFYIPNSFTPNNDGVNDFFAPQGTDALQALPLIYDMAIYNRWGEKIFETNGTSQPWYGQANGGTKIAEAGVYVYRIKFQDSHYSGKVLVGSVTLVR